VKLIDTHAHIDFPEFYRNRKDVIARAAKEGVGIINSCLNQAGFEKLNEFRGAKDFFLMIGCCPYRFEEYAPQWSLLRDNAHKIIGVGEIGLDYHWVKDQEGRDMEKENLLKLLGFAREHDKPVLIHSRNAEKNALDILESERVEKAVMHCFSGTLEEAERAIDLGYLVSIPTNVATSKQKKEFAAKLPLESLVLETDAPYLAPEPGTVNEPANIIRSAHKIAELKMISFEEVAKQTTKNAREMFHI